MIENYKSSPDKSVAAFICGVLFLCFLFYSIWDSGIESGRRDAMQELAQPVKYRCHEGSVYRRNNGYWESTRQACKTLEEIR